MAAPELIEKFNTFFLVEDEKSVFASAQFIAKRELGVAVYTDPKDMFNQLTISRPEFVIVSVNFTHPKLTELCQLLETKFETQVILFAEKQDRASLAQLTKLKDYEVFYGRLTGPSVVMKLRNLLLQKHLKSKREHDVDIRNQAPDRQTTQLINLQETAPSPAQPHSQDFWNHPTAESASNDFQVEQSTTREFPFATYSNGAHAPSTAVDDLGRAEVVSPTEDLGNVEVINAKAAGFSGTINDKKNSKRKKGRPARDLDKAAANLAEIERMAQNFVLPAPAAPSVSSMRVGLISFQSPDLEGYYVLFEQAGSEVNDAILIRGRSMIETEFKDSDKFKIEGCYLLYFDDMNPQAWLKDHAVFYNAIILDEKAFLLAFASHPKAIPDLEKKLKSMVEVDFNDMPVETSLPVEAYIFLPKNNKFIKYVAKGGELTNEQVERLINMSIDPLYIKENDVDEFKKSYIERNIYLVDSKELFKKNKAS